VAHYLVTIDGAPEGDADHRLLVTGDDGQQRAVTVRLGGQGHEGLGDRDAIRRAAVYYAVSQLEFAVQGEGWGVPVEDGPAFEVTVTADELARFVGGPSAGVPLDDGAVVGEFGA
jgi:hypothetical protein